MPNYAKLALTAQRLITKFGADCTLARTVLGEYNPETNTQEKITKRYTVKGVKLDYSLANIDGENIKHGDVKFYLEAVDLPVAPSTDDEVIVSGTKWSIVKVDPVQPATTVVYYELQLRK